MKVGEPHRCRRWMLCALVLLPLLGGESRPACITLALAGDVMMGRDVAQTLAGDWAVALEQMTPVLRGADLVLANLESPLTTAPQVATGYDLRAHPQAAPALRTAGFDALSLANNHALDAGPAGLAETAATLRGTGIVALLPGVAHCWTPQGYPSVCVLAFDDSSAPLSGAIAAAQIADAAWADLTVVSLHWGAEYQAEPTPRQQALARTLANAGADLIFGHGPHVVQRVEKIDGSLVAYSLGNLLFDQPFLADSRRGAILWVTLCGEQVTVEARATQTQTGCVSWADDEEAQAVCERLHLSTGCR